MDSFIIIYIKDIKHKNSTGKVKNKKKNLKLK